MITSEELLAQGIVVQDPATLRLYDTARTVARTDATVLIRGESGTGKDCLAKFIHRAGRRAGKPFLHLNCSALPDPLFESELFGYAPGAFTGAGPGGKKGLAELADGGTLFLDEIGEISPESQTKLLLFLENKTVQRVGASTARPVDIRVLCATNRDLNAMVEQKLFRKDLYYRINVVELHLAPLRSRRRDLLALTDVFCARMEKQYGRTKHFTPGAREFLARQDWAGNIRELQNLIERLYVLEPAEEITARLLEEGYAFSTLPEPVQPTVQRPVPLREAMAAFERAYIAQAIQETGSLAEAAERLGLDLTTLHRKKRQYHLYKRGPDAL